MVFPTLQFVLFFAVVLAVNTALMPRGEGAESHTRRGLRKGFLIAASYTFYAAWDWRFCFLMAGVSLVAYAAGRGVRSNHGRLIKVAMFPYLLPQPKLFIFLLAFYSKIPN